MAKRGRPNKYQKPIHKFNGGRGATLCHKCSGIISEGFTDDLYCEEHGGKPKWNYKLVRERDGLTKHATKIKWVEWNDDYGTAAAAHDEPKIGYSLIMDPGYLTFGWLTTSITEVLEDQGSYIKFKTKNSIYELYMR